MTQITSSLVQIMATINKFIYFSKCGIDTTITQRQVTMSILQIRSITRTIPRQSISTSILSWMNVICGTLVYFTDNIYLNVYDSSSLSYTYDGVDNSYTHKVNTFENIPDQKVNNIYILLIIQHHH